MIALKDLLTEIRACENCELPLGPNPVVRAHAKARLLIIGQAPGTKVHQSGIPWDDPSGNRLRAWLQMAPGDSIAFDAVLAGIPPGAVRFRLEGTPAQPLGS